MDKQTFEEIVGKKFFEVEFIKKDGTLRKMNARRGVSRYVKGTGKLSDKVIGVWDRQVMAENLKAGMGRWKAGAMAYRSIKPETIVSVKCHGHTYNADGEEIE